MCRVVSCPACGSVDSRAPSSLPCVLRLALLRFFSFSFIFIVDRKCYYYHYHRHIIHQSPTTTTSITSCSFLFLLFYIVSAVAVIPKCWTNLKKKDNSKEKKVYFFARQPTPKPASLQITFFLSFFSVPTQHHHIDTTSSLAFIHSTFLSGFDYSMIASCTMQIQPLELSSISTNDS
jgi:hypothetical protein